MCQVSAAILTLARTFAYWLWRTVSWPQRYMMRLCRFDAIETTPSERKWK